MVWDLLAKHIASRSEIVYGGSPLMVSGGDLELTRPPAHLIHPPIIRDRLYPSVRRIRDNF
jgi:hypothetical protein